MLLSAARFRQQEPLPTPHASLQSGSPSAIRTLRAQAGHQGLRQGPGLAEELLGANPGRRVGVSSGRKTCGMGINLCSSGAHWAQLQRHGQPHHPLQVLQRRNDHVTVFPVPFHKCPPATSSHPCKDVTQPWAPFWSLPSRRGHQQPEPIPTSPQARGLHCGGKLPAATPAPQAARRV